jgi:hypothetical protein
LYKIIYLERLQMIKHSKLFSGLLLSSIAITIAVFASAASQSTASLPNVYDAEPPPSRIEMAAELSNLGCTPEFLCAAGLSASESSTLLLFVEELLAEQWHVISENRETVTATTKDLKQLSVVIKKGNATPEIQIEYQDRVAEQLAAQSVLDTVITSIRLDVYNQLDPDQATTLGRIFLNRNQQLPAHYLVLEYTQREWATFCKAYAEYQTNPEPSQSTQDTVNAADMQYSVNLAQIRLSTNLESVQQVFHAFITTP